MIKRRSFFLIVVVVCLAALITIPNVWKDSSLLPSIFYSTGAVNDPNGRDRASASSKNFIRKSEFDQLNATFHEMRLHDWYRLQQQHENDQQELKELKLQHEQHQNEVQELKLQLQQIQFKQQQQEQHQQPLLPQCDEVMQNPYSPFRDGAFLTSFKTPIKWTPRADGSRQLDLDNTICHLKRYTAHEARTCLASQHISFIGDSITRYQFLSLAYFLEHDTFPPRFGNSFQPCTHVNEAGHETCSPAGQPNICMETDWRQSMPPEFGVEDWMYFISTLGGGQDGGIMNGRMECNGVRFSQMPSDEHWVDNELYTNGLSQTILSHISEFGYGEIPYELRGFSFTSCSQTGTCRQPLEKNKRLVERAMALDFDWIQSFPDAIGIDGVLRRELPRHPDIAIYNRGHWDQLSEARAQAVMPAMYDWVHSNEKTGGRCFYKSTTASGSSIAKDFWDKELHEVRPHVHAAGCEYLDYAYLTDTFSALAVSNDWQLTGERGAVYWDSVHYMPWVYEELNQVLLNVLCNFKKL